MKTTTVTKTAKASCSKARKLRFNSIEIIELPVGLGDAIPSEGAPISCCHEDPQLRIKVQLDMFEQHRPKRRSLRQMRIGKTRREKLLRKHGYSEDDISRATLEARKARFDRFLAVTCPAALSMVCQPMAVPPSPPPSPPVAAS